MKRIKIFLFIFLLASFFFIPFKTEAASWKFIWKNTTVHVPVGASIEDYKNIPYASLYKNEVLLTDTKITYNTEGDWLYYFKDIDTKKLGNYLVWYKAYDSKYSPGTCTGYKALVSFVVEDITPPEVYIYEPVYRIKRGSSYDLSTNYSAKDNYKLEEVKVSESINKSKVGTYPVTVIAKDSSSNETRKEFKVLVYEDEAPVILSDLPDGILKVPLNEKVDLKSHFSAIDSVEGDITSKIIFPDIKTNELSEKEYWISVTNGANLTTKYKFCVIVVDDVTPSLELSFHSVVLDYKTDFSSFDFKKYIKSLTDNQPINEKNLFISHNLENMVGSYTIWYSYSDGVFTVNDSIEVSLVSYDKPEVIVEDVILSAGESIDLMNFVQVYDPSDTAVSDSIEIYDSSVDYETEGTYYAEVYCINSSGKSTTKPIKVIIQGNHLDSEKNNLYFIGIISSIGINALLFVIVIVVVIVSKKKRKE